MIADRLLQDRFRFGLTGNVDEKRGRSPDILTWNCSVLSPVASEPAAGGLGREDRRPQKSLEQEAPTLLTPSPTAQVPTWILTVVLTENPREIGRF